MSPIAKNLQGINARCDAAIAGRKALGIATAPVTLVAVSKTKPLADVFAAAAAGQRHFGENYVQEAAAKIAAARQSAAGEQPLVWHLIGPLQSNKAKLAAQSFDWVQTIDRKKIAEHLSQHRTALGLTPLNVLVQVNVSGEASKSGVHLDDVDTLARDVHSMPGLRLRGLMSIVENTSEEAALRAQFQTMYRLYARLASSLTDAPIDTLSMGMSGDFEIAIREGATMVRVGSLIFGSRARVPGHDESRRSEPDHGTGSTVLA